MNNWKPMISAPKGKPILVTNEKMAITAVIRDGDEEPQLLPHGSGGDGWDMDLYFEDLTGWQEIPNPHTGADL